MGDYFFLVKGRFDVCAFGLVVICDGCLFPIHHACSRWQATFGDRKRHVVESKESNQILIHNPLGRLGQKRCQSKSPILEHYFTKDYSLI